MRFDLRLTPAGLIFIRLAIIRRVFNRYVSCLPNRGMPLLLIRRLRNTLGESYIGLASEQGTNERVWLLLIHTTCHISSKLLSGLDSSQL